MPKIQHTFAFVCVTYVTQTILVDFLVAYSLKPYLLISRRILYVRQVVGVSVMAR